LGVIGRDDVILALSYTGNTEELVRLLPSFKTLQVPLIALVGNAQSQLATQAAVWVDAAVTQEACPHNLAPTASTTLALAIGDALAITLMQIRGFDAQAFAAFHPGGVIGNRLSMRVRDIMHPVSDLALVRADTPMDEVVVESTRKKLGAVLVVDGTRLLGLITDGDIRRALQHREKFFSMKAADVMTKKPITIAEGALASEALAMMENRPSQIYELVVLDAVGQLKGMVRLHDVARLL